MGIVQIVILFQMKSFEINYYKSQLDIIVIGIITGASLLPFCVLVTEV